MGMISYSSLAICLLALTALVNADGWGQVASDGSDNAPPPAPAAVQTPVHEEPIAGGLTPVDLKDEEQRKKFTGLAQVGLNEINRQSNSLFRQNLIQVVKAYNQIVAGVLYHIVFTTGQSTCRNTPV